MAISRLLYRGLAAQIWDIFFAALFGTIFPSDFSITVAMKQAPGQASTTNNNIPQTVIDSCQSIQMLSTQFLQPPSCKEVHLYHLSVESKSPPIKLR